MPPGASRILLRGQLTLTLGVNPNVNTNPRPLSLFYGRTTKWFETLEHKMVARKEKDEVVVVFEKSLKQKHTYHRSLVCAKKTCLKLQMKY